MTRVLALAISLLLISCAGSPTRAPVGERVKRPLPASGFHTVTRGETLFSIAWAYELDAASLAEWNHIRSPYTIYPRQRLRVVAPPAPAPRPAAPVVAPRARTEPVAPVYEIRPSRPKTTAASTPAPPPLDSVQVRPSRPKTTAPIPAVAAPASTARAAQPEAKPVPKVVHEFLDKLDWGWPANGRLLRSYDPKSPGKKGISIAGNTGDDVRAAASGKVVYAGSGLSGYGRLIIIKHNQQYLSAYAHNKELLAREGDWVNAGQLIAHMGSSGTSRTQLYFEIRKNQTSVDPLSILPKR